MDVFMFIAINGDNALETLLSALCILSRNRISTLCQHVLKHVCASVTLFARRAPFIHPKYCIVRQLL